MKTKYNDNPLAFRTGPITVILPVEVSEPEADVIYDIIKHLRDQCIFNLLRIDAYMAKSDCLNDKELSGYIKVARIESYDDLSNSMESMQSSILLQIAWLLDHTLLDVVMDP